jgi:uncharacterized membrane protein YqhA
MKSVERFFERLLWYSRFVVVVPVIASLLISFGVFFITTIDGIEILGRIVSYASPNITAEVRNGLRVETISIVVGIIDGYLFAAIMLIFSLGMYELFVSKIDLAEGSEFAGRMLLIRSLDDLKDRLAKVVLLILIVKFFQQALHLKYDSVVDLLMLALGIILVSGALYLSHHKADESKHVLPHE